MPSFVQYFANIAVGFSNISLDNTFDSRFFVWTWWEHGRTVGGLMGHSSISNRVLT